MATKIHYVTGLDGWGAGEPTAEEQESFRAYVEYRLAQMHPGAEVSAEVSPYALESVVVSSDPEIDRAELRSIIGNEIWSDWCGGERAPEAES